MMRRSLVPEIMDNPAMPESARRVFHRELSIVQKALGNRRAILDRLRTGSSPVRSVIDIGCGNGSLLADIRRELGAEVTGIDLRVPDEVPEGVRIMEADATRDRLPLADVAIAVCVIHHLSEAELVGLIRNAGRSCRRLILLDLVRHPLPMVLFTVFVSPFVHHVTSVDGRQSIRRAFTPTELQRIVKDALTGTPATFQQSVSPFFARQIVDIAYE